MIRKIGILSQFLVSTNFLSRKSMIFPIFFVIFLNFLCVNCISRQDLLDHLKYQQDTRNTFDSRIRQGDYMKPLGYVAGKPIWPRVLDRVRSTGELFFDDDNVAYITHGRNTAALIRQMDRDQNYQKVLQFLERYTI